MNSTVCELKLQEDDGVNESDSFFETDTYRQIKSSMNAGTYIKIYRENHNLTQEQLGEKIGVSKSFVCDLEHNRRSTSKEMAKKLSALFNVSVEKFI